MAVYFSHIEMGLYEWGEVWEELWKGNILLPLLTHSPLSQVCYISTEDFAMSARWMWLLGSLHKDFVFFGSYSFCSLFWPWSLFLSLSSFLSPSENTISFWEHLSFLSLSQLSFSMLLPQILFSIFTFIFQPPKNVSCAMSWCFSSLSGSGGEPHQLCRCAEFSLRCCSLPWSPQGSALPPLILPAVLQEAGQVSLTCYSFLAPLPWWALPCGSTKHMVTVTAVVREWVEKKPGKHPGENHSLITLLQWSLEPENTWWTV